MFEEDRALLAVFYVEGGLAELFIAAIPILFSWEKEDSLRPGAKVSFIVVVLYPK